MGNTLAVRIIGPVAVEWEDVLGTDVVPIAHPVPRAIQLEDGTLTGVFILYYERLVEDQKRRVVAHLSRKHGLDILGVEERLRAEGYPLSAEYCIMDRINKLQIEKIRQGFREQYLPRHPEFDARVEVLLIAREIISLMLGHHWWSTNVFEGLGSEAKRMGYLQLSLSGEQEKFMHQDRVIDLADSLFLLQSFEGFDSKVEELRTISPARPEVTLEDTAIELQIAKMLVNSGNEIKFIIPARRKQDTYDLTIQFKNSITLAGEIKCRREDTPAKISSLRRILNKAAREQLPKEQPSILFARLPTDQVMDHKFTAQIRKFINGFFGRYPHVNALVFVWEEWVDLRGLRGRLMKYRVEKNPAALNPIADLDDLLARIEKVPNTRRTFLSLSFGDFSE